MEIKSSEMSIYTKKAKKIRYNFTLPKRSFFPKLKMANTKTDRPSITSRIFSFSFE